MSGSQARRVAAVATVFAIGAAVMFFFQGPARIVGVAALFTFIVAGLFLVASPSFLAGDQEGNESRGDD